MKHIHSFLFLISIFATSHSYSQPTPQTAAECAQEMIGRQVGNATPAGGCAFNLAMQLRTLSRIPRDGSRTEAELINRISDGFTSCYPAVPGASAAAGRFISSVGEINDVNSTVFGGSTCLGDMWGEIDRVLAGTAPVARVVADPHLSTIDGLNYNFQGEGIFTNLENDKNDFIIEGLYKKLSSKALATYAEGFAIKVGKNIINISVHAPHLFVNGKPQSFLNLVELNDGTTVSKKLNRFEIHTAENDQISISLRNTFLDLHLKLSPFRIGTIKGGLLGNFDLDKKNDLTSKNGILIDIETRKKNPQIYTELGDSYRVDESQSLFCQDILKHYPNGFDRLFPFNINQPPTSEARLAQAKQVCESKKIVDEPFLEDCIHDIVSSGGNTFVESAVAAQEIKNNPESIFRTVTLGVGFIGSYDIQFQFTEPSGETTKSLLNVSSRTDDAVIEHRVNGVFENRVVVDALTRKMTTLKMVKGKKEGHRRNAEVILSWETALAIQWKKTKETKKILDQEVTLYLFSMNNIQGQAWIAHKLKHRHILPVKYLLGLIREKSFPHKLLFLQHLFGYNPYGMILEAQVSDERGSRILKLVNLSQTPHLPMHDISDAVIRDQ